jgi:hypothetical protein
MYSKVLFVCILSISLATCYSFAEQFESCSSYYEINDSMACGADSYLNTLAIPYCEAYTKNLSKFSEAGQAVLRSITSCLQGELKSNQSNLTCDNIRDFGISSHYQCYVDGGFCNMPASEKARVMYIARRQIFNLRVVAVFGLVQDHCFRKMLNIK